jgi:adenylate kinase
MNKKIIILLGAPGAGKGTQAKLLIEKFNFNYIGSGDLLRARKKLNDFTGTKIGQVIDKGKRVATPVIFKLWMDKFEKFKKAPKFKGIIIDGSPRTTLEADMMEQALGWYEWEKNKRVILVDISTKEVIQRLTKRRMCEQCGRIVPFVGEFKKIKECDKCGGKLIARADDDEKGVKKRLEWFQTEVKPAINYYRKRGELIKINGEQSIEDVFKDILKVLK